MNSLFAMSRFPALVGCALWHGRGGRNFSRRVLPPAYQVFNKSTGASVQAPKQISSIFTGVGGLCGQGPSSPNYTDPIVLYDRQAGRWFIAIVAADAKFSTDNECI